MTLTHHRGMAIGELPKEQVVLLVTWQSYRSGALPECALESAAFTLFLYGRMIGCAAEIDDHLNRGRNTDTRTPQSRCRFVA